MSTGLMWLRIGSSDGSVRGRGFLGQLSGCLLLKKESVPWS
jgi:hypothetical protein